MKTANLSSSRHTIAVLFAALLAVMLFSTSRSPAQGNKWGLPWLPIPTPVPTPAPAPMPSAPAAKPVPAVQTTPAAIAKPPTKEEEFDGQRLYRAAVKTMADTHIALLDKESRKKWLSKWQDAYEEDEDSEDPEGDADKAVSEMLQSLQRLGYRFDSYLTTQEVQGLDKAKQEKSVSAAYLGDGIAYVKIKQFSAKVTLAELQNALRAAASKKALALDLRDNPGGEFNTVLTSIAYLLPEGKIAVRQKRQGDQLIEQHWAVHARCVLTTNPHETDPQKVEVSMSNRPRLFIPASMPMVVLVNRHSASAAEVMAKTLQHHRRAVVVGTLTCGKGTGQTPVELPYGRRLYITHCRVLPAGQDTDWIGVIPDKEVEQPTDKDFPKDLQLTAAEQVLLQALRKQDLLKKREEQIKKERKAAFEQEKSKSSPDKSP